MGPGKDGDELSDAATQWLIALDSGNADPAAFEAWRGADPRHAAAFAQVLATWETTAKLRLSSLRPDDVPVATAPAEPHPRMTRRRLLAGGSGLAVLAAGGVSAALLLRRPASIATAVGERRTLRLPDGSTAELNTDSLLSWDFDRSRTVWLERGEVALSVNAQGAVPFLLHAGGLKAILEAGRYNSRLYADGPELVAFNGGGAISRDGAAPVRLRPMHALSGRQGGVRSMAVSPSAADAAAAWRRGEVVFNGMTLDDAVSEFNRYLDRKLVIGDPAIAQIRLGGRFFVDDPDGFLRSLHEGFDIEALPRADTIVLQAA